MTFSFSLGAMTAVRLMDIQQLTKNISKAASISPPSSLPFSMSYQRSWGEGGSAPFNFTVGLTMERPINSSLP